MTLLLLFLAFSQPILDEAYDKLSFHSQDGITVLANGLDNTRSPGVQLHLLQEDLDWQERGYTKRQITIISAIALYKAIGLAEKVIENPDEKQKENLRRIESFVELAKPIVEHETETLGEIKDSELEFYIW